jgi:signal transduction histidine kinase/ligand-binding sensor domain-containing protein
MSNGRWLFLFLAVLLSGPRLSIFAARTVVPTGSPFIVDVWSIEDGLPQSSVISVTQARDGYLWLGTLNGLVRFDGMKFTLFDEANTPGLVSSRIVHLFEDSAGNLWVGTENAGVDLIQKNGEIRNFDIGKGIRDGRLVAAAEDAGGTVWLLTANGLLGRYRSNALNVLRNVGCKALIAETNSLVWLGADPPVADPNRAGGVFGIPANSPATAFVVERSVPVTNRLDFLLASPRGGFWMLADGRVQRWQQDAPISQFGPYPWSPGVPVTSACEDKDGHLIVGTYGQGVFWLDATGNWTQLSDELSHSSVLTLTVDVEGNLWIGTNGGGLNRVRRRTFRVLPGSEGAVVQSASEDSQGALWVGYNGNSRVDRRFADSTRTFQMVPDAGIAARCDVKSVLVDNQGLVWAGMWFTGDPQREPPRLFQFAEGEFKPLVATAAVSQDVSVIFQDRKQQLWVGTRAGLGIRVGDSWRVFTQGDGLPADEIRGLSDDSSGSLWIATGGGLGRLRDGQFTVFRKKDGLPSDDLSSVYADPEGIVWVGTRGSGLVRFDGRNWTHITMEQGLAGNSIGYMIEDGAGHLWLGSNAGLMRVSKASLTAFAQNPTNGIVCRGYVEADGLPSRECTQGSQPAACRTRDGRLWFPTTRGLVSVDPAAIQPNPYQAPVIIESVLVSGIEQNTNRLRSAPPKVVVVPPGREHLEIHYTSLHLGAAQQARFRYRLDDHETGWQEVGNLRVARYSKLPPGEYRFEVQAANEDGVWNPQATVQLIFVRPPFWKTAWFLTVASLALLGAVVATVHYVSTQKLQRQLAAMKQEEELEKERSRIARDLHDQLGANLMQVAMLADLAESDKDQPAEVESHAQQIAGTARETTRALDEIVWAVNPLNDTLDSLVTYICKYAQEYFELAGVRYRVDVPDDLPRTPLPPEVRHNIFLAAKEAVNNVVKHAQATEARLRLKLAADHFVLEVEDNGRGLGASKSKTGRNGLRNMRQRLEDVGGSFSISPAPERGAVARFTVPLAKH